MRFHASQRPGLNQEEDEDEGQEGEEAKEQAESVDISHIPLQEREYRVESSGARVTLASAKPLLYMFCAKMPADRYVLALLHAGMTVSVLELRAYHNPSQY